MTYSGGLKRPRETTVHLNKIGGLALACLLTAGSVAACSSTKKTVDTAAGKTTTTTAAPASGSSSGDSSGGSSGGSGSGGSLSAAQCVSAGAAYGKVLAGALAASTGNTAGLSELQSEYDALGASIPDNLKSDYDTVAKAYAQFEKDVKGSSLAAAEADLTAPDVTAAASKISTFFENHCQS